MATINFFVDDGYKKYSFSYEGNIIVEDFLRDYIKEHTHFETLDTQRYVFQIGMKFLNYPRYLKCKLKDLLKEGSVVRFIRKRVINWAGDKEYMEELLNMAKNDPTFGFEVDYYSEKNKDPFIWKALLRGIEGSIYEGGFYMLKIVFDEHYLSSDSEKQPSVYFLNKIFHPKVYIGNEWDGHCCLGIINSNHKGLIQIKSILEAVQNMFINYDIDIDHSYAEKPRQLLKENPDKFV